MIKDILKEIVTWIVIVALIVFSAIFIISLTTFVLFVGSVLTHHAVGVQPCQFGSVPGNSGECKRGPDFFSEDSATSTSFTLSPGQLVTLAPSSTEWNITSVGFSEPCYEIHLDGSVTIFWEECKTIDIRGSSTFGASPTLQAWKGYADDMANIIAEKNQQLNAAYAIIRNDEATKIAKIACTIANQQTWKDAFTAGWDESSYYDKQYGYFIFSDSSTAKMVQ